MANNPETTVRFSVWNKDFKNSMREMTQESNQLRNEFLLQQERMKGTASATDILSSRIQYLEQSQQIVRRQIEATRQQLERAKAVYGENSNEVRILTAELTRAELHEARLQNNIHSATEELAEQTNVVKKLSKAMNNAGEKMKGVGTTLSTSVTPVISGLGAAAMLTASEFEDSTVRIKNSLGTTAEEAEELAGVSREIYNNGFGEALADVDTALIQTKNNIKGLKEEDLGEITNKALVLAETFDAEVNEVTRAGNNVMQAFGVTAEESFDLMAHGAQNGLNFSNEMFDNLSEYAPLFSSMGFSAEEYFQLLEQGSSAGVYNLDYINDVMKETQIRLKDGSKATSEAMAQLSGETQNTWKQFMEGKATVKDVHNSVIEDLTQMDNKAKANQIGVALYGTKFEDLEYDAMMSLGGIYGGLEDVDGKMAEMVKTQEQAFGTRFKSMLRELKDALLPLGQVLLDMAEQFLPKIAKAVETVSNWFSKLSPAMQQLTVIIGIIIAAIGPFLVALGFIVQAIGSLIPIITKVISWLPRLAPIFNIIRTAVMALTGPIGLIIAAITALGIVIYKNWDTIKAKTIEVWNSTKEWLVSSWNSIKTSSLDIWNSIKDTIVNMWTGVTEFFTNIWNTITTSAIVAWDALKITASIVWASIVDTVKSIIQPFVQGVIDFFNSMKDGVSLIFEGLRQYFTSVWDLIKNIFLGAILLIVDLVTGDFEGMRSHAVQILENMKTAINGIWEGLKKIFSGAVDAIKGFVSTAWSHVKTNTTTVFEAIKSFLSSLWESIKSSIRSSAESVKTTVSEKFEAVKNSITEKMTAAKNKVVEMWTSIKNTSTSLPETIKNTVRDKFESLRSSVQEKMTATKNKIVEIWGQAKSFLSNINLASIGKDIIQGLINGIASKAGALWSKMKEITDGIKNSIKKALDIHSPSREMAKLGEYTGEGLAVGIQKTKALIKNTAAQLAEWAKPKTGELSLAAKRENEISQSLQSIDAMRPMYFTFKNEIDGYELSRSTYKYTEGMLTDTTKTQLFSQGVR